ncbi:MAG: hypothetical protein JWM76_193 [Pseudonocardiales bacterium]|nr:hypothetical protein [Pseudonocardiales bacterium]
MALSDYEQTVLREMELALRAEVGAPTACGRSSERAFRHYLAISAVLLTAGIVTTGVGLVLADGLGTVLGVIGFVLIVGSCWSATHLVAALRRRRTTRNGNVTRRPG